MKIGGAIPVMRVNYTIPHLLCGVFVSERTTRYREKLIEEICKYYSVNDVLLTSSARCAIYMIAHSLPQHKVIVPAYTCEVVIEAVKLAGKEIVFAPVSKETLNISAYPEIDADTIVIATHQYGFPCEISNLAAKCHDKGAVLVEDCAGSLGSSVGDKLTGTFGDYAVFSFSASKTLHSPTKGGFIIARNKDLLNKIQPIADDLGDTFSFKLKQLAKAFGFCLAKNRRLSSWLFKKGNQGSDHSETAYLTDSSYHRGLYEWQAHVLLKQFDNIEEFLGERRRLYEQYYNNISNDLIDIKPFNPSNVCIRFPVLVSDRKRFIEHCRLNHVSVGMGYNRLYCPESFSMAHDISKHIVYLPFGNGYTTKEIDHVIKVANSFK